jgi:MFS family permease
MTIETQRPTSVRYQVLFVACSAAVLTYIHRLAFRDVLPDVKRDLNLTGDQASELMSAFLLAYGAFEIPFGLLCDRLGSRHLFTLLVLGWSLATGCVTWAASLLDAGYQPFAYLLAVRFLFGLFQAGGFPCLGRILADWMPLGLRGTAQGLLWTASRLGGAASPWLVLKLSGNFGGWQSTLWIVTLLGIIWCVAFWLWFRNRPQETPRVNAAELALIAHGRGPHSSGHGAIPWRALLTSRSAWCLCFMYGGGGFAANFYVTLLPVYLREQRHISEETTALITSLPLVCGVISCLTGGMLSDWIIHRTGNRKWGRRLSGSIGTFFGALGWFSIPFVQETWLLGVVLCVVFFCNDLSMGPAWAATADIGERYAGTLGGAMNMIGNLSGAVGIRLAGYLFERVFTLSIASSDGTRTEYVVDGTRLPFIIFACSFLFAALCWQGVDVTKKLVQEQVTS